MTSAVTGLNHLTLAVTDLARAITFYRDVLGFALRAHWDEGAYLEAGPLWLCLALDDRARAERKDYSHIAFSVADTDFEALSARIRGEARLWKENRSEGASLYFLDPDGHRLELHVGSLESRLAHYRGSSNRVTILTDDAGARTAGCSSATAGASQLPTGS